MSPRTTNLFYLLSAGTLIFMISTAAREISAANKDKVVRISKIAKNFKKDAPKQLAEKGKCTKRELSLKDCELRVGKTKLNLFQGKWRFEDGLWLAVNDLPVNGETVQWDKVTLNQYDDRRILQLWLWSRSEGEAEVQALNWYVIEIGQYESPARVHEVVQRRRLGARVTDSTRTPATKQSIYIYDPRDKTDLNNAKKQLKWSAGRRHGQF